MRPYNADTERLPRGVVPGAINGARSARIEAFKRAKEPDRLRRQPRREASFSSRGVGRAALPSRATPPRVPIIPTPLISSLRRRAAMLAIPAAKAPRMAAPASLVIVPTPVLGSIVTTTTLPGGVLLGAGAGTGTGTDTGLPGTGLKGGGSRRLEQVRRSCPRRRWRCRHYHPS